MTDHETEKLNCFLFLLVHAWIPVAYLAVICHKRLPGRLLLSGKGNSTRGFLTLAGFYKVLHCMIFIHSFTRSFPQYSLLVCAGIIFFFPFLSHVDEHIVRNPEFSVCPVSRQHLERRRDSTAEPPTAGLYSTAQVESALRCLQTSVVEYWDY